MSTVLIASPEHLVHLRDRGGFGQAQTFSDAEALRALETITRERPSLVALERLFASTSRGTALINRIKADPALSGCELRIVSHDETAPVPASTEPSSGSALLTSGATNGGATAVAAPAATATPAALDQRGTRRAARTRVSARVEVLVDGNPAVLVDVSVVGAQVVSPTILRPNQRVRITLQDPARPIRLSGGVAWASFEMPKDGPRYRAGLEFFDADASVVGGWLARLLGS